MTINRWKQVLMATVMVMVLLPVSAMAGNGAQGPGEHGPHKMMGQQWEARQNSVFAQLNLSEEQKARVKSLMETQNTRMKPERQSLMGKHQQLMQMIRSGSGNRSQALALHHEIVQQQSALMAGRINFLYDLKEVLTPEQFEKASQLMKQQAMEHHGGLKYRMKPGCNKPQVPVTGS